MQLHVDQHRRGLQAGGSRSGGVDGNEILTSAAAVCSSGLLVAHGITIVHMQWQLSAHMFIGVVVIPPVPLKLGSTGYRMVSYYAVRAPIAWRGRRCCRRG